ncbi:Bilin biosynthesis protein CpeY [Richelia intracellularis HM01]|uniref:bilin biosynthesis protein CpeY n=1 Tax=Richelia intracellularis TaxID=1164990 RepID=UPI0002B50930|nr:bilin biosynthesis protein CpeY [Richelia intracellularis]CCH64670.1 Bilin biosynthesis protein CpeY [Richelia intracellularis HM01]
MATYKEKVYYDYGIHYHVVKILGWLKYQPAYEFLVGVMYNQEPPFQKSRRVGEITLGELGGKRAIPELKENLATTANTRHCKYP